jgi:uncharacterized protein
MSEVRTPDANVDAVRRFFELMRAKDIEAWGELWAEDCRIIVPYPPDGFPTRIEGKAELVSGFRRLFGNFETYDYEIRALYRTDDPEVVVVEWGVTARIASTAALYEGDNITVFHFQNGQIVEYHDYFNPEKFGAVVAALP